MCGDIAGQAGGLSVNIRPWLAAAIAAASAFSPGPTATWGVYASVALILISHPLRTSRNELAALAFVAWAWWSTTWAVTPQLTHGIAKTMAGMVILFIGVRHAIATRRDLRIVAGGYLAGCLIAVALARSQGAGLERATIVGINQNYIGYALAAGGAIALIWWESSAKTLRQRSLLLAYAAVMFAGIQLTGTRGALLGIATVLVWALVHRLAPRLAFTILVVSVSVVSYVIITGHSERMLVRLEGGVRSDGTLAGRLILWPQARQLWSEHWVSGIGAGGFRSVNGLDLVAHNVILETGVGLGVVGVALLLAMWWFALASDSKPVPRRRRSLLIGGFVAAVAPAYLSGAFEYTAPSWVALAIVSRIAVLAQGPRPEAEQDEVAGQAVGAVKAR